MYVFQPKASFSKALTVYKALDRLSRALIYFLEKGTVGFRVADGCGDVEYVVEVSGDLGGWSDGAELVGARAGGWVEWDLGGYQFVRLRVERRAGHRLDSDGDGLDDFFDEE